MNFGLVPDCCLSLLAQAGDEAILPAGIRLVDQQAPGRQCYLLLDGSAAAEAGGRRQELGPGTFIGSADAAGRPAAPQGVTVRLVTRSRVLVIDPVRLAALIAGDPAAAARWQLITAAGQRQPDHRRDAASGQRPGCGPAGRTARP